MLEWGVRGAAASAGSVEGTGFGLPIASQLIQLIGGRLELVNSPMPLWAWKRACGGGGGEGEGEGEGEGSTARPADDVFGPVGEDPSVIDAGAAATEAAAAVATAMAAAAELSEDAAAASRISWAAAGMDDDGMPIDIEDQGERQQEEEPPSALLPGTAPPGGVSARIWLPRAKPQAS